MLDFNDTLTIVRTCVNAGRPDLIEDALFERLSVSDLRAKIEAERPAAPAPAATPAAERDPLAAIIEKRMRAMYPPSPSAAGKS